jgi:hypothetical protein
VTLTPHNATHGVLRSPLRGITGCREMRRNGETIEEVVETLVALSADKHFCLPPHTKGRRFQPFEAEWLTVRLGGAGNGLNLPIQAFGHHPPAVIAKAVFAPNACLSAGRLSKVQSVDQQMRLECGVGFRQLRTCRRTCPGQLCANKRHRSRMAAQSAEIVN